MANQRFAKGVPWLQREYLRLLRTVEFLFEDPVAPLMLGRLNGNAQILAVETARREAIIQLGVITISRAQERGQINPDIDPAIAAAAINGGLRQAVAMALKQPRRLNAKVFADQVWG